MLYITHKRFNNRCLYNSKFCNSIPVNLPRNTVLVCGEDGVIKTLDGKPICYSTSEQAHQHFANDEDGNGLERGRLTQAIQKALRNKKNHQERWDKVWNDPICKKYKRTEFADYWLWNHEFFEAPIFDLRYILKLVKEV